MRSAVAMLVARAGCQLGEEPEPPPCEKGYHRTPIGCVRDETTELRVKISAAQGGTLCTGDPSAQRSPVLEPETLTVKVDEELQFENADVVAHEVRGTDGALWLTIPPGRMSDFTSIVKPGSWGYRISGCAKGGVIVVE